mmetsp:Transcript_10990/g.20531  ORF Transcript_10990/g.20531 Transcript_10990/m.20531 type:complete len:637 (+) Transcript_10990:302-2212(+)
MLPSSKTSLNSGTTAAITATTTTRRRRGRTRQLGMVILLVALCVFFILPSTILYKEYTFNVFFYKEQEEEIHIKVGDPTNAIVVGDDNFTNNNNNHTFQAGGNGGNSQNSTIIDSIVNEKMIPKKLKQPRRKGTFVLLSQMTEQGAAGDNSSFATLLNGLNHTMNHMVDNWDMTDVDDGTPSNNDDEKKKFQPNFDVLVVGSQHQVKAAKTQFQTWGSHSIIRNFVLATELDDPDPQCDESMKSWSRTERYASTCRNHGYWKKLGAHSLLTKYWVKREYASTSWLKKKKNPGGWLCAQKRFVAAFVKLLRGYHQGGEMAVGGLPDYLIVADDDTYMNMEHISEYLIHNPYRLKNQKGISNDEIYVPTPDVPVIFAGCRTRAPTGDIKWTSPFGGFGIFLSKAALEKWTRPIHCHEDRDDVDDGDAAAAEFEQAICNKYSIQQQQRQGGQQEEGYYNGVYPFNATIGENHFFNTGDSLNDVFYKYIHGMEYFCLHADWFFGYIANFLNISRHVVTTTGELPVVGQGESARWFDQFDEERESPLNRLHAMMGSELYSRPEGLCLYGNGLENTKFQTLAVHEKIIENNSTEEKKNKYNRNMMVNQVCQPNTTICHYMNSSEMENIYAESQATTLTTSKS